MEFRSATHGKEAVVFVVNVLNVMLLSGTELQIFWLRILGFGQLFSSFQHWVLDPVCCVFFLNLCFEFLGCVGTLWLLLGRMFSTGSFPTNGF